jgi:D-galactarolactone cycloisomerase
MNSNWSAGKVTIIKIDYLWITAKRPRIVGRNAFSDVQGDTISEPIVRLYTNVGIIGWGRATPTKAMAEMLIGKQINQVFSLTTGAFPGYDYFDTPLWDLVGRLEEMPVHALLGSKGKKSSPIYNGAIYFEDLDPETGKDIGLEPLGQALQEGMDAGYKDFKLKIGRGHKWMERSVGFKRDIEAIHYARKILGSDKRLLFDANNSFTFDEAVEFVNQIRGCDTFWFEEPFPENIAESLSFKNFLQDTHSGILLADGEGTQPGQREIRSVLRAGAIDVVQFDFRPVPISGWLSILPLIEEVGLLAAPHNWASFFLNYYIPHFGRALPMFSMAETDPCSLAVVDTSNYKITNGELEIPDTPGFGLELEHCEIDKLVKENGWIVKL